MTLIASLINTLLPALAIAAIVDLAFWLARGANASTRYLARWLALAAVLSLPLLFQVRTKPQQPLLPSPAAAVLNENLPTAPVQAEPAAPPRSMFPVRIAARPVGALAVVVWFSVTAVLVLRILGSCIWLLGVKRHSIVVRSHTQQMQDLLQRRGVRKHLRLLENPNVRGPLLAGFFRPAIILPAGLAGRLSGQELEHVLLHEIAHLLRRDPWTNLVARLIGAVLWFHPAVVWILRRQEQDREMACDEWAAQFGGEQRLYAASLARLAELHFAGRTGLIATGALGRGASISKRIESLLRGSASARVSRFRLAAVAIGLVTLSGLAAVIPPLVSAAARQEARKTSARTADPGEAKKFLAGLVAAGYGDISIDEVIELKNQGVAPAYMGEMSGAGLGRLSPRELIDFHVQGVRPEFVRDVAHAGFTKLSVQQVIDMSVQGVRPNVIAEIHRLGFGPYTTREAIDFSINGVNPDLFRALKQSGIGQAGARDIVDATVNGLTASNINEARGYGSKLSLAQILKLKKAGVI